VEQDCLFRTLSAILTLGNAEFEESPDDSGHECAYITESYIADRVAELLGMRHWIILDSMS
jgi:myosin heavy subunit